MQITVDPGALTAAQRTHVTDFINNWPEGKSAGKLLLEVGVDTTKATAAITELAAHAKAAGVDPELSALQKEGEEFDATIAFGKPPAGTEAAAVAAFGLPTPGPSAQEMGRPLSAGEATAALFGQHNDIAPPPPPPAASSVPLDKDGLPWDGRIHASTKTKTAKDVWTMKRGVDAALVDTVKAELRALMAAAPAPLAQVAPPPPALLADTPVAPAPPSSSTTAAMPPAPSGDPRQAYVSLIGRTSAAIAGGKITQAKVAEICQRHEVPALPLLANRLDLVAQVAAEIDAAIAA